MFVDIPLPDALIRGAILAMAALLWVVTLVRIVGLRSLSKMTSFDFVMTIAQGSLVANASQASDWLGFAQPMAGMAGLFFVQWLMARLRRSSRLVAQVMRNQPVVLIRDGEFDRAAMDRTRVSERDLFAKLRAANVRSLSAVRAAVLETTGDITVLHGDDLDEAMLEGVGEADS